MDITCCPIPKPPQFFCHKCGRYVWKYLVALNSHTEECVEFSGPSPGGILDWQMAQELFLPKCQPNDKIDKIFKNRGPNFVTPFFGKYEDLSLDKQEFNDMHSKLHWNIIERWNGRFHIWKITKLHFRGKSHQDAKEKHHKWCTIVANLVTKKSPFFPFFPFYLNFGQILFPFSLISEIFFKKKKETNRKRQQCFLNNRFNKDIFRREGTTTETTTETTTSTFKITFKQSTRQQWLFCISSRILILSLSQLFCIIIILCIIIITNKSFFLRLNWFSCFTSNSNSLITCKKPSTN